MIGTDIIEVSRIEEAIKRPGFTERVFTAAEWEYIQSKGRPAQSAAGIFCAKEAISKALGTGISNGIRLLDIEITHERSGKPAAILHGAAKQLFESLGYSMIELSISHSKEYAVALCMFR
ncbi:MAG: holo-ACP synthase [Clostridiales bacterium]|jgi:holo-[acyl-carrier protein] synthase|nr:holo-ACP synthase [Clostridiales bacterium]